MKYKKGKKERRKKERRNEKMLPFLHKIKNKQCFWAISYNTTKFEDILEQMGNPTAMALMKQNHIMYIKKIPRRFCFPSDHFTFDPKEGDTHLLPFYTGNSPQPGQLYVIMLKAGEIVWYTFIMALDNIHNLVFGAYAPDQMLTKTNRPKFGKNMLYLYTQFKEIFHY